MFLKRLFEKLMGFVRNLFCCKSAVGNDELSRIADAISRLIYKLKPTGSRHEHIIQTAIALRHLRVMRESIAEMMVTTEPDVFSGDYYDVLTLAQKIGEFECIDNKARSVINDIIDMLSLLSAPAEDSTEDALVYYSVTFGGRCKEYYYLSDGKGYEAGQYVLVPVGVDMEHKIAKIVSIDRFTLTNAPMHPDELKVIISRAIKNPSF